LTQRIGVAGSITQKLLHNKWEKFASNMRNINVSKMFRKWFVVCRVCRCWDRSGRSRLTKVGQRWQSVCAV